MIFICLLTLFSLFGRGLAGQYTLQLNTTTFDASGCADPLGTYTCYQDAYSTYQTGEARCNPSDTTCLQDQITFYQEATLGCMAAGCWNQALTCESGFMTLAFLKEQEDGYIASSNYPPFVKLNHNHVPGGCVCHLPAAYTWIIESPALYCAESNNTDACECCGYAESLAALNWLCSGITLDDIGINDFVAQAQSQIAAKSNCSFMSSSNWADLVSTSCPVAQVSATPPAGYLNPLSLPTGFPGTGSLSNLPGYITDVTEYPGLDANTTFLQVWNSDYTQTYTLASGGQIAAVSAGPGTATPAATSTTQGSTSYSLNEWPGAVPGGSSSTSAQQTAATTPAGTAAATHAPKSGSVKLIISIETWVALWMLIVVLM